MKDLETQQLLRRGNLTFQASLALKQLQRSDKVFVNIAFIVAAVSLVNILLGPNPLINVFSPVAVVALADAFLKRLQNLDKARQLMCQLADDEDDDWDN